ncbi:MAG: hypothetical protein KJO98_12525 [Rhodothermia bacterium]|nr:hypothetical protein [Rhodothermia bacterium]NNL46867.1 hypothetical protein [Acidimicrobiia bacterium]
MKHSDLSYPVICLGQDGSIVPHQSAEEFGKCNALALWVTRYFADLTVIDSAAVLWRVESAIPKQEKSGIYRWLSRLTNRTIRVDIEVWRLDQEAGMAVVKRLLVSWLDRMPEFWEASADLDEWRSRVESCRTVEELAILLE